MTRANPITSLWHDGERRLQASLGVDARMAEFGPRVIRDHMPEQHRDFYRQLPFLVLGSVDADGRPWATVLAGEPGFVSSPDPRTLAVATPQDPSDPASAGLRTGDAVGLLGIELHTRRRNRMNGVIGATHASGFDIGVEHAFGNCPQYIHTRVTEVTGDPSRPYGGDVEALEALDAEARAQITAADTFFVASYVEPGNGAPQRQVDVSHRGGKAGFVRIDAAGTLTIPDFAGNLHFNTLGNLLLNPRAGLLFVDFDTGDLLQLTGTAEVILDSPDIAAFQGAERLWTFTPTAMVRRRQALPLRFGVGEASPNSLFTGSWDDARARLDAEALGRRWRPFTVDKVVDESASVRSFHLLPADGRGLIRQQAGQHLPIRVRLPGEDEPVLRTYTLSSSAADGAYRISVKRDGALSNWLHDHARPGIVIEARAPAGQFVIDAGEHRPAVLLAGGIGITPLLAMLREVVYEGLRTRGARPTWLLYGTRTVADRAFDDEIADLVQAAGGAVRLLRVVSQPEADTVPGQDYDAVGRIDGALLSQVLPFDDYDFYLCGPPAFTQSLYDGLRDKRVADDRIHAEAFGPAGLTRGPDAGGTAPPPPAVEPVPVVFADSGKEARWEPISGTLLDLAEARGLTPEFSCRGGSCGTCRTPVRAGAVTYDPIPTAAIGADEALLCCAVPAASHDDATQPLVLAL